LSGVYLLKRSICPGAFVLEGQMSRAADVQGGRCPDTFGIALPLRLVHNT